MKRIPNSITVIGAAILLVLAIARCGSSKAASHWKLDCESEETFTWQGTVTDASGRLLEPGEYSLKYCYFEGTTLIGCCETEATVAENSAAKATVAMAQPIWEDTTKISMADPNADVWLEISVKGVLAGRSQISGVTLSAGRKLLSVKRELERSVQRIDELEKQLSELQTFRIEVTAALKTLSESLQPKPLLQKGYRK